MWGIIGWKRGKHERLTEDVDSLGDCGGALWIFVAAKVLVVDSARRAIGITRNLVRGGASIIRRALDVPAINLQRGRGAISGRYVSIDEPAIRCHDRKSVVRPRHAQLQNRCRLIQRK